MAEVEVRLLGQVEVWRDGTRVGLGGPKQRAVLASLAVRAGRPVPVERLIDDLWPDDPPARAAATVQVFVSNLRRALEPGRSRGMPPAVLVTEPSGYRLAVQAAAVDANAFVGLAQRGRAALDGDDPDRAAELLRRAERLWHGPALAGVPETPLVRAESVRLTELRLAATEDRVDAELALGRHTAVVADLEQLVLRHPLRERPRAQLMLALYRSGRQADALASYRTARRVLRDELGLEPGARLRELERAVLRQDRGLIWKPAPPPVELPADGPGRVLVVDDSGAGRTLLAAALTAQGHEVRAAADGRRALELLRSDEFDVVLLDLLMPVLDGYATLAKIKADPGLRHLPVIMVSAVSELESVVRCIELGAADYLPKPFSAAVLRARLRSSLAAKRLRDAELGDAVDRMRREVAARESALRAEIAALRAQVGETA